MSRRATTKWNLIFFYVKTTIGLINGLLIVPFYLKFIDNTLFGFWLASGNILTWITIMDPGVGDVLVQKVAASLRKQNRQKLEYLLSSSLLISLVVSSLALALSYVFSAYLHAILDISNPAMLAELTRAFKVNAIATCITLFSYCLTGTILGFQRTKEIGLAGTITGICGIVITLVLLFNGFGLMSIAYASLAKSLIGFSFYIYFLLRIISKEKLLFRFHRKYFASLVNLYSFTFSRSFFRTIASNFDLVIISRVLGPAAVTLLEITRRPIRIAQNFVNIPSQSLLPAFSNLHAEGDQAKTNQLVKRFLTLFFFTLFLFISGFAAFNFELISLWVGEKFFIGDTNNYLLCFAFLVATFCYNLSNLTYCMGNIKANSVIEIIKSVLYLLILYPLVIYLGVTGALLAIILASLLTETWYYPKAVARKTRISGEEKGDLISVFFKGSLIALALIALSSNFEVSTWPQLILKAVFFTLVYSGLYYLIDKSVKKEMLTGLGFVLRKIKGKAGNNLSR